MSTPERQQDRQMVRYLLGQLTEEERAGVQERLLTEEESFEQAQVAENDLVDAYVKGELPAVEREQFERSPLNAPDRRGKLRFARALAGLSISPSTAANAPERHRRTREVDPLVNRVWISAGIAAAVVLLAAGGLLLRESAQLRARLSEMETERMNSRAEQKELQRRLQQREQAQTARGSGPVLSFLLSPTVVRGSVQSTRLQVQAGARQVLLELEIEAQEIYKRYAATLRTQSGYEVWSQSDLPSQQSQGTRVVVLTLPAPLIAPGRYELTLSGIAGNGKLDPVGYYYFSTQQ